MMTVGSAQELLARASWRQQVQPADARAGAVFERVTVGPESFFVKRLSPSSDWVMRIAGDHVHRPYLIWRSGLMDRAPDLIDHTVVAMDLNLGSHSDGRTILLDRTLPGAGPACWDLCWYLALNRARLPEPKEAAISRFRAALEGHGSPAPPPASTSRSREAAGDRRSLRRRRSPMGHRRRTRLPLTIHGKCWPGTPQPGHPAPWPTSARCP
jgi:hypothetical protein